jgi:hypothetical protein
LQIKRRTAAQPDLCGDHQLEITFGLCSLFHVMAIRSARLLFLALFREIDALSAGEIEDGINFPRDRYQLFCISPLAQVQKYKIPAIEEMVFEKISDE